jgi:hypothetical protein
MYFHIPYKRVMQMLEADGMESLRFNFAVFLSILSFLPSELSPALAVAALPFFHFTSLFFPFALNNGLENREHCPSSSAALTIR